MRKKRQQKIDKLLRQLHGGSFFERVTAARSLRDAGDTRAIPALRMALAELDNPKPAGKIDQEFLFDDPNLELRVAILDALTKLIPG